MSPLGPYYMYLFLSEAFAYFVNKILKVLSAATGAAGEEKSKTKTQVFQPACIRYVRLGLSVICIPFS